MGGLTPVLGDVDSVDDDHPAVRITALVPAHGQEGRGRNDEPEA
jgi:hypothetical protein